MFKKKRVIAYVIAVVLLTVMITVSGCGGSGNVAVAEVNGDNITRGELDAYLDIYRMLVPDIESMLEDESVRPMIEGQVLDAMVENLLAKQVLAELEISVTDEEVEAGYEEAKIELITSMFSDSEEEYNTRVKELKIKEKDLITFFGSGIYFEKLETHLATEIDDADVTNFIAENPLYGKNPDALELSHILFESKEDASAARERLLAGEDFGDLAVELSVDETAQTEDHPAYKGYLGKDIPENTDGLDATFMAGANAIENDGDVSEPIESQFGWHLIKLHQRIVGEDLPSEEAYDNAFNAIVWETVVDYMTSYYEQSEIELNL